ncbi:MAG: peptidylprolyl isomerase, partial [Flaviramulus sp.]
MKYALLAITLIFFTSCGKDNPIDYVTLNDEEIQKFISDNSLNAEKSNSGLYYVIDNPGSGTQPNTTSNVTVAYKGYYTSGSVFDQSDAEGVSFNLQRVIRGWTEGITYFKEGGSGMLLVP